MDQISVILGPIGRANDTKTNARFIEARVMRKVKVRILSPSAFAPNVGVVLYNPSAQCKA